MASNPVVFPHPNTNFNICLNRFPIIIKHFYAEIFKIKLKILIKLQFYEFQLQIYMIKSTSPIGKSFIWSQFHVSNQNRMNAWPIMTVEMRIRFCTKDSIENHNSKHRTSSHEFRFLPSAPPILHAYNNKTFALAMKEDRVKEIGEEGKQHSSFVLLDSFWTQRSCFFPSIVIQFQNCTLEKYPN